MIIRVPSPHLTFARLCGWLVLLGRSSAAKSAGLLVLRHEVLLFRTSLQPHRIRQNLRDENGELLESCPSAGCRLAPPGA